MASISYEPAARDPSQAVIDSMLAHGIAISDAHFTVWQCYLEGSNPDLKRAIDILLSNGMRPDERVLRRLHGRHFTPSEHARKLSESAQSVLQTFNALTEAFRGIEVPDHIRGASQTLRGLMEDVLRHSQAFTDHYAETQDKITQLERYLESARRDAGTDELTGVGNRRALDEALRSFAGAAMNNGTELGVIIADIDYFKTVNDRWGHLAGDAVLRRVAATLSCRIRRGDFVARYGGEEFAAILPGTSPGGAVVVAEDLRKAIESQVIETLGGKIEVTISAGVSCYQPGESMDEWIARADAALYAAKRDGRNRTKCITAAT